MYNPRHVTKGRIIQRKVPVDFDTEITDADFVLDPSLIDSQAGQYFVKDIGLFGEADPTEKVGSVIAQQTADAGIDSDEHPASANVPVPPSHQKEGRPKVLRKIMKGGMIPSEDNLNLLAEVAAQSTRMDALAQAAAQAAAQDAQAELARRRAAGELTPPPTGPAPQPPPPVAPQQEAHLAFFRGRRPVNIPAIPRI